MDQLYFECDRWHVFYQVKPCNIEAMQHRSHATSKPCNIEALRHRSHACLLDSWMHTVHACESLHAGYYLGRNDLSGCISSTGRCLSEPSIRTKAVHISYSGILQIRFTAGAIHTNVALYSAYSLPWAREGVGCYMREQSSGSTMPSKAL